ncbi:MAG: ATP-binding cassette domain-containing protein [Nitrososphaeria archaeon]|nr:ATP-binding cassette domain-containing protein [Nitrososphaeria archaeon]NIN52349.1 ATP-binding cassette domain-containing protein [Nitrososphaeria archaeon]NIQ32827.1 ATP-binding cassette domain-containing protein [Nitrososphaeria archaeon]
MSSKTILEAENLTKYFPLVGGFMGKQKSYVRAVDDISFNIMEGETFGLVGESGCGKTTTGRLLLRLIEPTAGKVIFQGKNIPVLDKDELLDLRKEMQIIFQNPHASFNPRKTLNQILSDPFIIQKISDYKHRISELLEIIGLTPIHKFINRFPHELSGGQRQRLGIARAIALNPSFIVADEPVSSVDMSIRAQILNLMKDLQKKYGISYLLITHDLSVVRNVCSRIAVMYLGKIVELAGVNELYSHPLHPYTKALLSATPIPNPKRTRSRERILLTGDVPSAINPPPGCRFHTRCSVATPQCKKEEPQLVEVKKGRFVACHQI